jgi:sugar phosphate permease
MRLLQYKNWVFSVLTVIVLAAGAGYIYTGNLMTKSPEMVSFTDLSDADIDQILEVKSAMYAASIEAY